MLRKHLSTAGKRARVSREKSAEIDRRIGELCPDWPGSSQELAAQLNQEFQLNWDEEPYRKRAHKAGHTWPRTRDNDCIGCGQRFTSSNPNQRVCSGCRDDDRKCRCVPFQDIDQENYIICPYCKQEGKYPPLRRISPSHLAVHGKNMEDLRREHPDAVITSTATRKANKAQWAVPKIHRRRVKSIRDGIAAPGVREKHSASMKLALADPEKKQRILDGVQKALLDPEKCARRNEAQKIALAKPSVHRTFSAARTRDWQREEVRPKLMAHVLSMAAERECNIAEARRLKNVKDLDFRTGLRVSLTAHMELRGQEPKEIASNVYADSSHSDNAFRQMRYRLEGALKVEKQRISKLRNDQRHREEEDLNVRLKQELAKPLKKSG